MREESMEIRSDAILLITLVFIVVLVAAVASLFVAMHLRPLDSGQVKRLALKKRKKRIRAYYTFDTRELSVSREFKRQMKPTGEFCYIDQGLFQFPSVAAALLKYKKHEWIIVAFERDQRVSLMWLNKGPDRSTVTLYLPVERVADLVRQNQYTSVLIFHNHPNPAPYYYDCTNASTRDAQTARGRSDVLVRAGANLLEFVCERGRHYRHFALISNRFLPTAEIVAEIQTSNGLSAFRNLSLHLERLFS
jgi:hypothetical protein